MQILINLMNTTFSIYNPSAIHLRFAPMMHKQYENTHGERRGDEPSAFKLKIKIHPKVFMSGACDSRFF